MAGETVLVVDDDPDILNMINLRLTRKGFNVVTAADGNAAVEQCAKHKPDLMILDVMMPGKNGWEVAKAIRADAALAGTKIVMLTAIGAQVNAMTSPLYGADAYLDKPFDFAKLDETIKSLLGG